MATSTMLRFVTTSVVLFRRITSGKLLWIAVALTNAVLATVSSNITQAQSDLQPYMVYVDQEGVSARCGPGGDFYRTDPLRHGQALEVYVETEEGWLGIRPPEDSFCWLPADVVKLSPNQDYGIVKEDNALAWIGTHLGKANKYLWQVQLSEGEEVAILGRAKREGPDGVKLWFRIVPPAGEFRWVHRDQVVNNPEMLLREKPQPGSRLAESKPTLAPEPEFDSGELSETASSRRPRKTAQQSVLRQKKEVDLADNELHPIDSEEGMLPLPLPTPPMDRTAPADRTASRESRPNPAKSVSDEVIGSGLRQADNEGPSETDSAIVKAYEAPLVSFLTRPTVMPIGHAAPEKKTDTGELADSFDRRDAPRQTPAFTATYDSRDRERALNRDRAIVDQSRVVVQPAVVPASSPLPTKPSDNRSIDGLQLELSRLMSRSAPASELEAVVAASTQQAQSNPNESERMRASMLIQRAREYQAVARRRDGDSSNSATAASAVASYPAPVEMSSIPAMPSADSAGDEATGYLVQVFSARPDSPPFALTDKRGLTVFYVSPAPGFNVRRFLNQFVTINGTAGYTTGLDTPHIIATGAMRVPE